MIIGTHDGLFHADEIFAIATLKGFNNVERVIRTRNKELLDTCTLKIDVGGGRFDHHIVGDRKYRANGVPYASFGLVWEEYGEQYIRAMLDRLYLKYDQSIIIEIKQRLDSNIVQQIDAADNSVDIIEKSLNDMQICDLFDIIFMKNIQHYETYTEVKAEERFNSALKCAEDILFNKTLNVYYGLKAKSVIKPLIEKGKTSGYIILDEFIPFKTTVSQLSPEGEIKYVIHPASDGNWNVVAIQKHIHNRHEYIQPFPIEWRGKAGAKLQEITNTPEAVFCHIDGFLTVFTTKKAAIQCVKKLLES